MSQWSLAAGSSCCEVNCFVHSRNISPAPDQRRGSACQHYVPFRRYACALLRLCWNLQLQRCHSTDSVARLRLSLPSLSRRKHSLYQSRSTKGRTAASQHEFQPSSDPEKVRRQVWKPQHMRGCSKACAIFDVIFVCHQQVLTGRQLLEKATTFWKGFSQQAASPSTWLSGASTATAAVLLAFPFHSSFHSNISQVSYHCVCTSGPAA